MKNASAKHVRPRAGNSGTVVPCTPKAPLVSSAACARPKRPMTSSATPASRPKQPKAGPGPRR